MALSGQGKKIGLLGGSFNPAHAGHVYISQQALALLDLDEIWWLVSPQNPLKEEAGMASFAERFDKAKEVAAGNDKILVSDFENNLAPSSASRGGGKTYTFNTISALKSKYPDCNFVWLMGADNMLQFPKWHRWRDIMNLMPVAVFNRGKFKEKALLGEVAVEFATNRVQNLGKLSCSKLPAWAFLDIKTHPMSATKLREELL